MKKDIYKHYTYTVADCEHEGDIRDAISEVEEAGGMFVSSYWDGHDCGEAWVEFMIPVTKKPEDVLRKLHMMA